MRHHFEENNPSIEDRFHHTLYALTHEVFYSRNLSKFLNQGLINIIPIIFEETLLGGGIQLHCCALAIRVQDVATKIMCHEKIGFVRG